MPEEIQVTVPVPDTTIPEPPDPTVAPVPTTFVGGVPVLPPVVAPTPVVVAPSDPVVAPTPAVVAPLPELRYEYQPKDADGRKLGGMQVIKYRTPEELADKLRDQNIELVRKLREVTKQNVIGGQTETQIDDLEKLAPGIRPLTTEEKYQLAQDFSDPTKVDEARLKLLESAGYNELQFTVQQLLARDNAKQFLEKHVEDFNATPENMQMVIDWMVKKGLQPTVKNFEKAQVVLEQAGLLEPVPIVREEAPTPAVVTPAQALEVITTVVENTAPNSQVPVAEVARISEETQPQQTSQVRVPSGLNSRIASDAGVPLPTTSKWTLAMIDAMSGDDYLRLCRRDPEFAKEAERLEKTRAPRPSRR
jgi:hypothetical protein